MITREELISLLKRGMSCNPCKVKEDDGNYIDNWYITLSKPSLAVGHQDLEQALIYLRDFIKENESAYRTIS